MVAAKVAWGVGSKPMSRAGGWHCNSIGVLESGLCTGESFDVAIIFFLEVGLEIGHGLLHSQFVFPLVNSSVEYASFDDYNEHELHCSTGLLV